MKIGKTKTWNIHKQEKYYIYIYINEKNETTKGNIVNHIFKPK